MTGCVGRKLAGHRVKAGAEHFHRDPGGMSQGMHKLEVRLRRGVALQGGLEEIEETMTRNRKRKYLITYASPLRTETMARSSIIYLQILTLEVYAT